MKTEKKVYVRNPQMNYFVYPKTFLKEPEKFHALKADDTYISDAN